MAKPETIFYYHTRRVLKGLQDDFDKAKTVKQRIELAKGMETLLDTLRAMEYAKEFARNDRKDF